MTTSQEWRGNETVQVSYKKGLQDGSLLMHLNRSMILIVLATLTICFLGAAYTLWFNPTGLPIAGAGDLPVLGAEPPSARPGDAQKIKLTISETGITALTASQLQAAGLSFSELSSDELVLTYKGEPVPFLVKDAGEEPTLYFYAQKEADPHKPLAVYELQPGVGLAMLDRDAQPFNEGRGNGRQFYNWEDDVIFVEDGTPGDAWMSDLRMAPSQWQHVINNIHPDGQAAALTLRLFTNVETQDTEKHHIEIRVNQETIAEHSWQGAGQEIIRVPISAGILLPEQANIIELLVFDDTAPIDEAIYIDSIELAFDGPIDIANGPLIFQSDAPNILVKGTDEGFMVFNVSDPASPVALDGARSEGNASIFAAGARDATYNALNTEDAIKPVLETTPYWRKSLLEPDWEADYIAIVADVQGFEEAIDPLLLHRREQGLQVARVSVEQIFDEFGYGHRDPQAIKDFISHAIENWGPSPPQYVLLVGDATYDVTNMTRGKNRNRLPTRVAYRRNGGYAADDTWFTTDADNHSQIAIGRFPAQNAPQLRAMVQKTIDYEAALLNTDNEWAEKALLITDDNANYDEEIANLASKLAEKGYSIYQLHMDHDNNTHQKIMSALDDGIGLVYYLGEGSDSTWGDQAVLQNTDTQGLRNTPKLPILNTFTSPSGSFAHPSKDSLAESLLRAPNGGIIASVAPSGTITDTFEPQLTALFYEQFETAGENRLGKDLMNMYNAAGESSSLQEAMVPINLLGDPALLVAHPAGKQTSQQEGTPE
jgi:hypothetical protein